MWCVVYCYNAMASKQMKWLFPYHRIIKIYLNRLKMVKQIQFEIVNKNNEDQNYKCVYNICLFTIKRPFRVFSTSQSFKKKKTPCYFTMH